MFDQGLQVFVARHLADRLERDTAAAHVHDGGRAGGQEVNIKPKKLDITLLHRGVKRESN